MKVSRQIDDLPEFKNAAVTIGTFDGVHTGHLQILQQLKKEAAVNTGESVVITFDPHPRKFLTGKAVELINTMDERIELFEKQQIDHLVIVPFTREFASLSAEKYIKDFLVGKFHPKTIVTGYDHHFGNNREGNYLVLESYAPEFGYTVKEIPQYVLENAAISSTKIRSSLLSGNVEDANTFLGYPYFFSGTVVEGNKLGRTIGFPTANIQLSDEDKLVPGNGVFAVILIVEGHLYKGMMNIGKRPTVGGLSRVIEVNIFDFDNEIYGQKVSVHIHKRLRNEEKFNGLDALKEQLGKDKVNALEMLSVI